MRIANTAAQSKVYSLRLRNYRWFVGTVQCPRVWHAVCLLCVCVLTASWALKIELFVEEFQSSQ